MKNKVSKIKVEQLKGDNPVVKHQQIVKIFKSKFNKELKWYDKFADLMTEKFGTVGFFTLNFIWFVGWLIWNNFPGLPQFDPYPHNFLTMVVSLEAIFLSIIVLISQNRQAMIADLREEIDFNVNIRAEQEITKILNLIDEVHDHLGLNNDSDQELSEMKLQTNLEEMEEAIAREYLKKGKK